MMMAKAAPQSKAKKNVDVPSEVVVTYHLHELPTAFHKAGLAGLVMLIESLIKRGDSIANGAKYKVSATTVEIAFNENLVQLLMDDMYDARFEEAIVKAKWPGAEILRPPTAAEKEAGTPFVYKVVQPKGQFLRDHFPEMPNDKGWLKLWRDMLWNIPRSRPTTREPFNQRAAQSSCKEGASAWEDLLKLLKAHEKKILCTAELSSALLPGCQAVNAENVPFEGSVDHNLLLHFWPLAVLVFVPQSVDVDGTTNFVGYSLAIPEVSDLYQFTREFPILLSSLSNEARGYRPSQSVIDIAAESGLAFLDKLAMVVGLQIEGGDGDFGSSLHYSIGSVDYLHLVKQGNNVKTMASGRIVVHRRVLAEYRQFVAPKDESVRYKNPLFRRGLLSAILDGTPWYRSLSRMFATFDDTLFIRQNRRTTEAGEKGPPQFANDAAKKLQHELKLYSDSLIRSKTMPEQDRPNAPPAVIINRVVRGYIQARIKDKTNIDPDKFKTADGDVDYKAIPREFNEAKQKLAQSLFLEFRSRRLQAFVDHFAATFFSVTQRLTENDRLSLASMLIDPEQQDDLKTLTLLSISANS
jgi:CRISPR-associated protein Cmx8